MNNKGVVVAYNGADAGLGNRIRVTLGAARYARWRRAGFAYVWPTTDKFQPKLTDLWDWHGGTRIPRFVSRTAGLLTGYVGSDLTTAPARGILQIRTGGELIVPEPVGSWTEDLRALVPVSEIADLVTRIHRDEFAETPYVGVQIRTHPVSHSRTRDTSPTKWFSDRMHRLVDERPDTRFYISCDVNEVKQQLLAEFPSARAHLVDAPYNSTAAVRAAIVDLYLLASSSYMMGPHGSSFIEIAQFLADMAVPTDKPTERPSAITNWRVLRPAADPLRPSEQRQGDRV